jgi:2,5-diamino-6-(ribosylamino)-4(3H)-pyrimidinone 5'-phosphate reductase
MSLVDLPATVKPFLAPYTPRSRPLSARPFVTLTYAQSLDARIAATPGVQTKISHPETKTMTHYIRSVHDAILVGVGTMLADDPKLNCRYSEGGRSAPSPRPVVLDPHSRWNYLASQLRRVCDRREGKAPYVLVDATATVDPELERVLTEQDGAIVRLALSGTAEANWRAVLAELARRDIGSVMVEGGARVIDDLLVCAHLVDSLIVTVGPVYLGAAGVAVSPARAVALEDVSWWRGAQDSVMCARMQSE